MSVDRPGQNTEAPGICGSQSTSPELVSTSGTSRGRICKARGKPVADDGPVAYAPGSDQALDLCKQLTAAKTPTDKTAIQRRIDATDRRIDDLVYELYGLTDDEIRIVEEAATKKD